MKPNSALSSLLGISAATGSAFNNAYLKVDPATAPGAGIVAETIQYHGPADRYALSGAQAIAAIHSNATTATTFPAVTLRDVGTNGGQAAAFTFDLPRSIVADTPGQPGLGRAWNATDSLRFDPMTSSSVAARLTGSTSARSAIPQADEQQRLLANLIQVMNRDKKPLPRFWYFPRDIEAVVIATGDDHGNGGTAGRFDQYAANSPSRLLGDGLDVPAILVHMCTQEHRCRTRPRSPTPTVVSRSGFTRRQIVRTTHQHQLPASTPTSWPVGSLSCPSVPSPGTQPVALHCLQRLVIAAEGRAGQRHPDGRQLLLLARVLDSEPTWLHDRLGHADAVRRHRRNHDRHLPVDDSDDRRVWARSTRSRPTPCSTMPSDRRATTARSTRICTPTRRPFRRTMR